MPALTTHPVNSARPIALWLFICAASVFLMIIIGAITRLSESGLSIVEWKPLIGAIPPLNEAEWHDVFTQYQQSPEFQKKNFWMELGDFKKIFFWEWLHRFWGRMIGLIFALPLAWFWLRGQIPPERKIKFLGILALGGAQGLMGWYMVQSGLIDEPAVSHYRLAAHLGLALLILALLLWQGLSVLNIKRHPHPALHFHTGLVLLFAAVTIFWGALTAGLDAGLVYNETFPKMGGQWLPPDFWAHPSFLANILQHHSGVQFMHRWLALLTVALIFTLWAHGFYKRAAFPALQALAIMALMQMGLGIATLLSGVNLHIAVTHQAGAVMVLALLVACFYITRKI